jgi:hypothetical protein
VIGKDPVDFCVLVVYTIIFPQKQHADHTTTFQTIGTFIVFNITTIIAARYAATPQSSLGYAFVAMLFVYGFFYDFKYDSTSKSHYCIE